MKYLTMVMRCGDIKDNPNMMVYTLISDELNIHTMTGTKLAEYINTKKANVVNMAVSSQGLVSTNGSIKNYTTLDKAGNIVGTPKYVILGRVEVDGKLSHYQVFAANGTVGLVSPAEAAALASKGLLANGKIRHTSEGDIVAAIGGTYPLIEKTQPKDVKVDKLNISLAFFGVSVNKTNQMVNYVGMTVLGKNARTVSMAHKKVEDANAKLIKTLKDDYGYEDGQLNGFKIKVAQGAGFYGVYPIESVVDLLNTSDVSAVDNVILACTDCGTPDFDESVEVIDSKAKAVVKSSTGNSKTDTIMKKFESVVLKSYLK